MLSGCLFHVIYATGIQKKLKIINKSFIGVIILLRYANLFSRNKTAITNNTYQCICSHCNMDLQYVIERTTHVTLLFSLQIKSLNLWIWIWSLDL